MTWCKKLCRDDTIQELPSSIDRSLRNLVRKAPLMGRDSSILLNLMINLVMKREEFISRSASLDSTERLNLIFSKTSKC